jgi:hypothetical protein
MLDYGNPLVIHEIWALAWSYPHAANGLDFDDARNNGLYGCGAGPSRRRNVGECFRLARSRSGQCQAPPCRITLGAFLPQLPLHFDECGLRERPAAKSLRWRSQFAPEPACHRCGFHRVGKRADTLMNVIASGAFECSDVKAGRARGDPGQHRYGSALRTWWPVKRAHDAVPCIRRERYRTLGHRIDARDGPVIEPACSSELRICWSKQLTSK